MAMHRAMNDMFGESLRMGPRWMMEQFSQPLPVDVYETDDALVVEAALPGFEPEAVDITINHDVVTIKAEASEDDEQARTYHLRERVGYESFERQITLPIKINADGASAIFKNGILTLTLPKAEETRPKRVSIKAG